MVDRDIKQPEGGQMRPVKQIVKGKAVRKSGETPKFERVPGSDSPRTLATKVAKKEVEQNPFVNMIDIKDLVVFEQNPDEVEKECQNILLRHNTDLKNWYKLYQKVID